MACAIFGVFFIIVVTLISIYTVYAYFIVSSHMVNQSASGLLIWEWLFKSDRLDEVGKKYRFHWIAASVGLIAFFHVSFFLNRYLC